MIYTPVTPVPNYGFPNKPDKSISSINIDKDIRYESAFKDINSDLEDNITKFINSYKVYLIYVKNQRRLTWQHRKKYKKPNRRW